MVGVGLTANLQPFRPGSSPQRRSVDVDRAIRKLRKAAPQAVDFCLDVLGDESEETALRVKIALAIIEKVMPGDRVQTWDMAGIVALRVEFVTAEAARQPDGSPVIEAEPERHAISVSFVKPNGHDDE